MSPQIVIFPLKHIFTSACLPPSSFPGRKNTFCPACVSSFLALYFVIVIACYLVFVLQLEIWKNLKPLLIGEAVNPSGLEVFGELLEDEPGIVVYTYVFAFLFLSVLVLAYVL